MYKHDFHRNTFGNEQILAHPNSNEVNNEELEPKIITGGADPRKRIETQVSAKQERLSPIELAQKVSSKIKSRGASGIMGLGRSFKVMDRDHDGQLSL